MPECLCCTVRLASWVHGPVVMARQKTETNVFSMTTSSLAGGFRLLSLFSLCGSNDTDTKKPSKPETSARNTDYEITFQRYLNEVNTEIIIGQRLPSSPGFRLRSRFPNSLNRVGEFHYGEELLSAKITDAFQNQISNKSSGFFLQQSET